MGSLKPDVIIPTYRPGRELALLLERLEDQTLPPGNIILMNTQEELMAPFLAESRILERYANIRVYHVDGGEFDHGGTRHRGICRSSAPFFLCMTQDAVPRDEYLIERLLEAFREEKVAVAYARQFPKPDSDILERFTREFNYPAQSRIKSGGQLGELGIKTFFCSNVCAAYRREIYDELGGFIRRTIFNEDMIFAGRAVQAGYLVAYQAGAGVIHSHRYTGLQQLRRNLDLGISQADHPEVFSGLASEKEGKKLAVSMLRHLKREGKLQWALPFFWQSGCKLLGYRLGRAYRRLPRRLVKKLSMNRNYWK